MRNFRAQIDRLPQVPPVPGKPLQAPGGRRRVFDSLTRPYTVSVQKVEIGNDAIRAHSEVRGTGEGTTSVNFALLH